MFKFLDEYNDFSDFPSPEKFNSSKDLKKWPKYRGSNLILRPMGVGTKMGVALN